MTKIPSNISVDDLPAIPVQIRKQFKHLSEDEELELRVIAYKTQDFFKWLEAHHANILHSRFNQGDDWLSNIERSIRDHDAKKDSSWSEDSDELKLWRKEEKRLKRMHKDISDQWLSFGKELRVITQNSLAREQPRKVEMTQIQVKPSDVAKIIRDSKRELVDVKGGVS